MPAGSLLRLPTRAARTRYLTDLRSIYGSVEVYDPDYALLNDAEFYRKMERDPVIYSAIDMRLKTVVGQTWHLEAATEEQVDKDAAGIFEELLDGVKNFQQSRLMLFRGALLMGRGYAWTRGRRYRSKRVGEHTLKDVWCPHEIRQEDKRRFMYEPTRDRVGETSRYRIGQKLMFWDLTRAGGAGEWVEVTPAMLRALVRIVYNDRADLLGMGQGLGTPLFHYFRQKALAWRDWAQAGERWAQGIVAMKLNQDREGTKTNSELVDDALETLDYMRSRNSLVYGEGDEVQLFETSDTGMQISADQITYIDQSIIRLFTGGIRTMGGDTETGARSQGEVEQESMDVIAAYDRSQLDEAITETLIKPVWELNRPMLYQLGLQDARMPTFATSPDGRQDPLQAVQVIAQALGAQIPLRKADVYEALGFAAPSADDEVFKGAQAIQPTPFTAEER